ncbi:MAG: VOC family protein [Congregibacter sp.]
MLTFDHIAIATTSLDTGSEEVEDALQLKLESGGQHPAMGTHNKLLSLGPDYLEVIATDPLGVAPSRPRWFDLDNFTGAARATTWICRCDDLGAALAAAPPGAGEPLLLARADLRWRMAVPADGKLPFAGLFPALMQWDSEAHPAPRLTDQGARLIGLELYSPQADALRAALDSLIDDPRIKVIAADEPRMRLSLKTPKGMVVL